MPDDYGQRWPVELTMRSFNFIFLADSQLGCYATFSGSTADDVERFARRGMKVMMVPKTDGFEWDAARYREAIKAVNRIRPAFVVLGGDMIDSTASTDQLREFRAISATLDEDIPLRFVAGNHDAAANGVVPTPDDLRWYRDTFGPDHYTFEHEGAVFIVLNTAVLQHPGKVPDEAEAQYAFLEDELRAARDQNASHVVVFAHHPPFLQEPDEPDTYWNLPADARRRVLDLLHAHDVRLVLSGHLHRNNVARDRDLEIVASGAVGFPLGDDAPGLRVVDVDADYISHRYLALEDAL